MAQSGCVYVVLSGSVAELVLDSVLGETFIAGGDITRLASGEPDELRTYVATLQQAITRLFDLPIPVVSLVDGHCLGGGMEIALATDIIVATTRATFGLPSSPCCRRLR